MNKTRRKEIDSIINRMCCFLNDITVGKLTKEMIEASIDRMYDDVESVYFEEELYMDNIPENLQYSYRYEVAEAACDNLNDAMNSINEAKDSIEDITKTSGHINDAINSLNQATM